MSADALHRAAFLGSKGENADELERLLLEVLHDHVFWRRNFHPSDPRLIGEREKRSAAYTERVARLRDELFQILAALKRAAPVYSPRQAAHIVSDPSMPALVGYFAGMLYNQNNVVAEVSPETVREEREYMAAVARMVSYPRFVPQTLPDAARAERHPYSWGHLCSGGTVANLEALWIARNVRLYPLAVRLVAATHERFAALGALAVTTATGDTAPLDALSTFALANLPIDAITDLHLRITDRMNAAEASHRAAFEETLPSVRKAGLAGFLLRYNETFPDDPARLPIVLISQAAHYCWEKNMDLVGLGAEALHTVPVDRRIRLDTDALAERLQGCLDEKRPVLGVISICGTTEEGAIDPIDRIHAVREQLAGRGLTVWHHCDAAFGGFFAAMLPKTEDGAFADPAALNGDLIGPDGLLAADNAAALAGLAATDSLTVDPHKFGYVPYPSGAVLFRDYHVRDAIAYAAPYLNDDPTAGFDGFLGQWTLEGSRPGAAAVSCYLSQTLIPLTPDGHGRILRDCIATNQRVYDALTARFTDGPLRLVPFHEPETVAFCFLLVPKGCTHIADLNAFHRRIWKRMTVDGREDINQYDLLISKTEIDATAYAHVLDDRLPEPLLDDALATEASVLLLRTCLMNPFQADWEMGDPPFSSRVADFLYTIADEERHTLKTTASSSP